MPQDDLAAAAADSAVSSPAHSMTGALGSQTAVSTPRSAAVGTQSAAQISARSADRSEAAPGAGLSATRGEADATGNGLSAQEDLAASAVSNAGDGVQGTGRLHAQADSAAPMLAEGQSGIQSQLASQGVGAQGISAGGAEFERSAATQAGASSDQSAALSAVAGKAGLGVRSAASDSERVAHGSAKSDAAEQAHQFHEAQGVSPVVDASTLARYPADERGTMSAGGGGAGSSTGAGAGSSSRDTFAALDSEDAQTKPTWVHAGSQQAEAGFQDPSLGWVGVRADSSTGGIHASLVAGTADAAQALGSHLAGLNAYLAEHHSEVAAVTLSAPDGGWADGSAGQGSTQQGTGQGTGQELSQGAGSGSQSDAGASRTAAPSGVSSGITTGSAGTEAIAQSARPAGAHISVMA
jgi:hypothetical protein